MLRRLNYMIGGFALGFSALANGRAELRSPWDGRHVNATDASYTCPAIVHLSRDLTAEGFYSDSKGSVIDPEKWKAYSESSGPYKKLGQEVVDAADAWRSTGSRQAAQCALQHMTVAAQDGVFTGKMSSRQAYYVQGWVIGAIALSYLKVRDGGLVTPEEKKLLLPWFETVTRQTVDFYTGNRAKNNHLYWAGLEAVAVGVAADNRKLFDWGVGTYRVGINQIQPDGSLPEEMRRGSPLRHRATGLYRRIWRRQRIAPIRRAGSRACPPRESLDLRTQGQPVFRQSYRHSAGHSERSAWRRADKLGRNLAVAFSQS